MIFVLKNSDNYYLTRNKNLKLGRTLSLDKAETYQTLQQAMNMSEKIPNYLGGGWRAVTKDNIEASAERVEATDGLIFEDLQELIRNINKYRSDYSDIKKTITNKQRKFEIQNAINRCDLAQSDVLHYIENNENLDMYTAWKIMKLLKSIRKKRRSLKKEKALGELLSEKKEVDTIMENQVSSICSNVYNPRVLNDMFDKNTLFKDSVDKYLNEFS